MKSLNLDKLYIEWILSKTNIFSKIHPNYISLAGLLSDFGILYFLNAINIIPAIFLLMFRYHCDCLDGAVARKYNKVSNLGGLLDTIADHTLIFIIVYSVGLMLGFMQAYMFATIIVILNLFYLIKNNAAIHHNHLKYGINKFKNAYILLMDNNIILYSLIIVFLILK